MAKVRILLVFLWFPFSLIAQEVKVDGYFLADSAKLGERVGYVLKATYPAERQLIFPDSTFDFSPFVLLEKQTFLSSTQDSVTSDSTIYYLSNFELDSVAYLTLPVFELSRYDSITHFPLEASIAVKWTIDSIPEELMFQENNVYQPIPKKWDWVLIGIVSSVILILIRGGYWLFGARIRRFLFERNEKRRWKKFEKRWKDSTASLESNPSMEAADELLGIWKGYMESITSLPIREWTSSELGEKLDDIKIFSSLRTIELIIYAGAKSEIKNSSEYLLQIAKEKYEQKLKNIKHDRATV
ncbi:hypothetical protein [Algoriphagus limi]|uniref:Oxygen tolerance n=1 Tax=Algoriphagus limi TaxID=2975273 RepID=A0ABT2G0J8_9BACT|nr:hypothetical protein [Algoriphagus limi]MCS5488791.1 hypothetical protein [Algoriphagus limi]